VGVRIEIGDMVSYDPSGTLRWRIPDDDGQFHHGIVVAKKKGKDDRKINYDVLWDDCHVLYGYLREELMVVRKVGRYESR
jgi:hypothetical protein